MSAESQRKEWEKAFDKSELASFDGLVEDRAEAVEMFAELYEKKGVVIPEDEFNDLIDLVLSLIDDTYTPLRNWVAKDPTRFAMVLEIAAEARQKVRAAWQNIQDDRVILGGKEMPVIGLDLDSFVFQYQSLLLKAAQQQAIASGLGGSGTFDAQVLRDDYYVLTEHEATKRVPAFKKRVDELLTNFPDLAEGVSKPTLMQEIRLTEPKLLHTAELTAEEFEAVKELADALELSPLLKAYIKRNGQKFLQQLYSAATGYLGSAPEVTNAKFIAGLESLKEAIEEIGLEGIDKGREIELASVIQEILVPTDETFEAWKKSTEDTLSTKGTGFESFTSFMNRVEREVKADSEYRLNKEDHEAVLRFLSYLETIKGSVDSTVYAVDGPDGNPDEAARDKYNTYIRAKKHEYLDALLLRVREINKPAVEEDEDEDEDDDTAAEAGRSLENLPDNLKPYRLWFKFLKEHGYDENNGNKSFPDEHNFTIEHESLIVQQAAFVRWVKRVWWNQIAEYPDPFNKDVKLSTINLAKDDLKENYTLMNMLSSIPEQSSIFSIIFGVIRHLEMGSAMYVNQLDPGKQFELYLSSDFKTNHLEHLFKLDRMETGALTMSHYLQFGLQFIAMHDPVRREQYSGALKEHLADHLESSTTALISSTEGAKLPLKKAKTWGDYFPKDAEGKELEPKYNGAPIHDILYNQQTGAAASKVTREFLMKTIAEWIMAQDVAHGRDVTDKKNGKKIEAPQLSFDDAMFVAVLAVCTAESHGIIGGTDSAPVSKRIYERFEKFEPYRKRKAGAKKLGSKKTYPFFRKLLLNPPRQFVNRNGVSIEQKILLTGCVKPDLQKKYNSEKSVLPDGTIVGVELPDEITELRLGEFPQDYGRIYHRISGYVMKCYEIFTGKGKLGPNWLEANSEAMYELRAMKNDVLDYYAGDLDIKIGGPEKGESEEQFYNRIEALRTRMARNGYILLFGPYVHPTEPGKYVKDGADGSTNDFTENLSEAKKGYAFSPMPHWFGFIHDEHGNSEPFEPLLVQSNKSYKDWIKVQELFIEKIGADIFGRMRLELLKWLMIDEMALLEGKFKHKKVEDQIHIIEAMMVGLVKEVHASEYVTPEHLGEEVDYPPFGSFTIEDVEEILRVSGWHETPFFGWIAKFYDPKYRERLRELRDLKDKAKIGAKVLIWEQRKKTGH